MKKIKKHVLLMLATGCLLFLAVCFSACGSSDSGSGGDDHGDQGYESILINEVQSNDTDGFLESDFVELYNASESAYTFKEGEWYMTDSDGAMNSIMYIPGGTRIEGHGYLVLLPDEETLPVDAPAHSIVNAIDGVNLPFGLGSEDGIYLYYMGSSNPTPDTAIDSTTWTRHVRTRVRIPDEGEWVTVDSNYPTPGAANQTSASISSFSFVTPPVDGVIDETAKSITVGVPAGTDLTALVAEFTFTGASIQVETVDQISGVTPNDFSLPVTYTAIAHDSSTTDYTVTVRAAYSSDILINEVQSNDTDGYLESDFIELYNAGASSHTFAEGEWYITDSDGASEHICYIPDGTTLDPGAYLVLLPNEETLPADAPAGSIPCMDDGVNSSFGLGGSDSASLFYLGSSNPNPAVPVDSTSWTSHVRTRSRVPDGEDWSATDDATPTPGETNGF